MRDAVVAATERAAVHDLSRIAHDEAGDTIYAIDRISEEQLVRDFAAEVAPLAPVVLIAEGLPDGGTSGAAGRCPGDGRAWRVIVDPIDGTRGLMYQKRSAWILTGVAPNLGEATSLRDIVFAVQTEVPLVKQHLTDQVWAVRGGAVHAERLNRLTGERVALMRCSPRGDDDRAWLCDGGALLSRTP
jgi:fructose-1,6-bisphosphatase/inositol monophosphatase family enzyme